MALSDEQIAQGQKYLKVWQRCTSLPMASHHLVFAQTIEAEVRKDYDALIEQMLDKLSDLQDAGPSGCGWKSNELLKLIEDAEKRLNNAE